MNKLGFAIKLASQGAGNAIECNKGQWTNKVVDIREYLKLFNGLQGTDNIVTFMSFDEGGCFLTQLKAISGRVGDFLSGWIYIPNTIEASGEEIMSAYNYVRNILSQSNLSDLKDDIESFFSKEYPSKEVVAQYVASRGQFYGVRYLGHYTLKEIVGEYRYQPYYSDYKAVFLLNKEEEVTITRETLNNFGDLTNNAIVKTSILVPPADTSLQSLGRGTKIHTIDGSNFNQPRLVNVDSKILLILSRVGFEDKEFEVNVISERQDVDLSTVKMPWMKKISASMFTVRNRKQEKIDKGVRISVNDTDITFQDVLVSEEDCRHAFVKVSAPDYEVFEQSRNLLTDDFDITLRRKVKQVKAKVELSNGSDGEMIIVSKHLPSNSNSPLKGYEFCEDYKGNKVLKLSSWFVWKQRVLGFFTALVAAILIIAYTAFDAWSDTHHFKFGLPPWEADKAVLQDNSDDTTCDDDSQESDSADSTYTSLDSAIEYLDNNPIWSKSEMEKYADLKGLYDDMNNFNLTKLINDWHSKLSKSQKFKKVYESAKKTYKNWDPRQGEHDPTYNKLNDEKINITNYTNWLDKDQTPAHDKNSQVKLKEVNKTNPSRASANAQGNRTGDLFDKN